MAFSLSACQTTGLGSVFNANLTPEERQLRNQADDFNQTIVEGTAIGAVLGGIIGALACKKNDRGKCAAMGAGIGALAGAGAGLAVANAKAGYAEKQNGLNQQIAGIEQANAKLTRYIATAKSVIDKNKVKLVQIKSDLNGGNIKIDDARKEYDRVSENSKVIHNTIINLKKKRTKFVNAAATTKSNFSSGNTSQLDSEIVTLSAQVETLENAYAGLVKAMEVNRIG
jgi:uncharacterized protein YcfJ